MNIYKIMHLPDEQLCIPFTIDTSLAMNYNETKIHRLYAISAINALHLRNDETEYFGAKEFTKDFLINKISSMDAFQILQQTFASDVKYYAEHLSEYSQSTIRIVDMKTLNIIKTIKLDGQLSDDDIRAINYLTLNTDVFYSIVDDRCVTNIDIIPQCVELSDDDIELINEHATFYWDNHNNCHKQQAKKWQHTITLLHKLQKCSHNETA